MTPRRQEILDVLKNHGGVMSAADISQKLPDIDLATIYRTLDVFTKERLISKLHLNDKETEYEYAHEAHHHAVCTDCERVIHFTAPDAKIKKLLGLDDFEIDELEVTVRGICKK